MLLEFGVKNFKSIKDEAVFSLIANDNESKLANVFTHKLATGEEIRLLKSAAIFGANASGKTSFLEAVNVFYYFILYNNANAGGKIELYNSFKFNAKTKKQPVYLWMSFIGPNDYKYKYAFSFNDMHITEEKLSYYTAENNTKEVVILQRTNKRFDDLTHEGKLGEKFEKKEFRLFHNKLFLSKFGRDEPHEFITPIFRYFDQFDVLNTLNGETFQKLEEHLIEKIKDNKVFKRKLETLIRIADTKLSGIAIKNYWLVPKDKINNFNDGPPYKDFVPTETEDRIELIHKVFDGGKESGQSSLDLYQESRGTLQIFLFGGIILDCLERGGILFLDEIDTSLHPMLVKTLLEIIQSKKLNPKNAQVVITTHDVNVLNHNIFRRDQYWFTEKNKFGETELFSLQDFDGVSEDTPFSSWYMAGKFGAIPNIQSIEKILDGEKETD